MRKLSLIGSSIIAVGLIGVFTAPDSLAIKGINKVFTKDDPIRQEAVIKKSMPGHHETKCSGLSGAGEGLPDLAQDLTAGPKDPETHTVSMAAPVSHDDVDCEKAPEYMEDIAANDEIRAILSILIDDDDEARRGVEEAEEGYIRICSLGTGEYKSRPASR